MKLFLNPVKLMFAKYSDMIAVVILVILDALFVLCELLLDLSIIEADEHHIAPQVFHYLSLALLTFFMVELGFKLYAFQLAVDHYWYGSHGILLSVKSQADHKVHKLKEENDRLLHQISELQEHKTAMTFNRNLSFKSTKRTSRGKSFVAVSW
ncbi:hypothetical protein Q7C36_020300 [Tachysurus vachellii]|uniref:Hydrogen voltage-gated channel 1 n=1 Tax=Tachysurus vachellii TaxID=175792 RepID=A0AA88LTF0_TACVA|nr:hypothetical protein Q7C36_020300 [Tachysurus vachellii]